MMIKWIYKGVRKRLFGTWCYPGDVVSNPTKPPGNWTKYSKVSEEKVTIDDSVGQTNDSKGIEELRNKLGKMKMQDLRKIGKEYDVYDTKKSELVDEIIQAKLNRGEL